MPPRPALSLPISTAGPLALVLLCLLPAAARARQAPAEVDPAAFVAALDALARAAETSGTADEGQAVVQALPPAWTVRVGRERIVVSSRPIAEAARPASDSSEPWAATRGAAVARIRGMRDEAARLTGDGPARPAHVRRALGEVLASPEFRGRERYATLMSWWDSAKKWLRGWFPSLETSERAVAPAVRWFSWIVAAAAFVLLAGLVWRLLSRSTREARIRVRPAPAVDAADARTWASRARAALAAGQPHEAVRCAYHAVLHRLDEEGAWTLEQARTPREYVRLLGANDRRRPAAAAVARAFEGMFYGGRQPALDDAQAAVSRLGELGCDAQADPAT